MKCSSGGAIRQIGLVLDRPCGEVLTQLGKATPVGGDPARSAYALLCPKCDQWPKQHRSE